MHRRLGAASLIRQLDSEICRLIADEASKYTVSKSLQAPGDFNCVGAAVNAVPDGATIMIKPGVYDELPIVISARFRIPRFAFFASGSSRQALVAIHPYSELICRVSLLATVPPPDFAQVLDPPPLAPLRSIERHSPYERSPASPCAIGARRFQAVRRRRTRAHRRAAHTRTRAYTHARIHGAHARKRARTDTRTRAAQTV